MGIERKVDRIIPNYEILNDEEYPKSNGKLYKMKDFDGAACRKLYNNFFDRMIETHVSRPTERAHPYIVMNAALKKAWS